MGLTLGQQAEKFAAAYLAKLGFEILHRNWRNKFCEIDIVAERNGSIHFVEVKYRRSDFAGRGIDYITPRKLKQMETAAKAWMGEYQRNNDFQLDVITIDGEIELTSMDFIQNVTGD